MLSVISIHAPREGRDERNGSLCQLVLISIHAPREGRDATFAFTPGTVDLFQSTRPARGATKQVAHPSDHGSISIHAPREGRDTPP